MVSNNWSWVSAEILALATTVALPLAVPRHLHRSPRRSRRARPWYPRWCRVKDETAAQRPYRKYLPKMQSGRRAINPTSALKASQNSSS